MRLTLASIVLFLFAAGAQAQEPAKRPGKPQQIAVYGCVVDQNGAPLGGVVVDIIVPGSGTLASETTDKDTGRYIFRVVPDEPFDIVFNHTKFRGAVVPHLAHSEHQHISRTLYPPTHVFTVGEAHQQYQSYERFQVMLSTIVDADKRVEMRRRAMPSFEFVPIKLEGTPPSTTQNLFKTMELRIKEFAALK